MSKIGKAMYKASEATIKAGGIATKYSTEAISDLGKAIGVSEKSCDNMKTSGKEVAKDFHSASKKVSRKVEDVTDEVVDNMKDIYSSVKNKFEK